MNTIWPFGRSFSLIFLGALLSFSSTLYGGIGVLEEKALLFSENTASLDQGNIHISSALMEKDELLGDHPELRDIDQNGLFRDEGVKYLFSKLQFKARKGLSSFSKNKIHNPKGFEDLSENVTVKESQVKSNHQVDFVVKKNVSLVSFTSKASFYYFDENTYQNEDHVLNVLESLLEGRKPHVVTFVSTAQFSKFFNKAVNYCFYEGMKEKEVLVTCFSAVSVKRKVLRKFGWIMDFRKAFQKEILYTARQISLP